MHLDRARSQFAVSCWLFAGEQETLEISLGWRCQDGTFVVVPTAAAKSSRSCQEPQLLGESFELALIAAIGPIYAGNRRSGARRALGCLFRDGLFRIESVKHGENPEEGVAPRQDGMRSVGSCVLTN